MRRIGFTLQPEERGKVEAFANTTKSKREYRRAQGILLVADGHSMTQAAQILGVGYSTVKNWVAQYRSRGAEFFRDKPRPGQPRKVTDEHISCMRLLLESSPANLGYRKYGWNCQLLREELVKRFAVKVSAWAVWSAMRRSGYRFRRPKLHIGSPDPLYAEKKTNRRQVEKSPA